SYTSSTDRRRQPDGQDVLRRVHVPVVGRPAVARPGADVQRHPVPQGAAGGAQFGGGEPAVDRDHFTAVPSGLVLQHAPEFRPGRVADGAGQAAVLHHVPNGEVLDHDRLVLTNEPSGQLVQVVTPAVGD